ncbi:hypothetical protein GIB67_003213 [Kingdonia uniflora]|uniref:RNase H type-1 domain-containing protein n=1 Tax=Kingdonia uniflora TaxID=39325 RepID=A0A7J7LGX7_9MAGN|nr:hypothetical protein GIB67_003213 [Kingdonia uniflora]
MINYGGSGEMDFSGIDVALFVEHYPNCALSTLIVAWKIEFKALDEDLGKDSVEAYRDEVSLDFNKIAELNFEQFGSMDGNNKVCAPFDMDQLQFKLGMCGTQGTHLKTKLACSKAVIEDTSENRICLQDWNLLNCLKTIEPIFCKWKKPHTGFHAINTDGSLSEVGGFGAMLRTEEGIAVKAVAGRVRAQSVIIHELQGIEAGLLLGLRMEIEKVILFTDSEEAYHLLSKEGKPPWRVKRIVERIKKLMLRFVSCLMEQVFREANAAADFLSKIKPMDGFIEMDPSEFSHEMLVIVDEDAAGKPYMRL